MDDSQVQPEAGQEWKASQNQIDRAQRCKEILDERAIPTYFRPLFVDDDAEVVLPSPIEVAKRAAVIWVVARAAGEHVQRDAASSFLRAEGLWETTSPNEQALLLGQPMDGVSKNAFVWKLEALVALLWALSEIESLDWPGSQCNLKDLSRIMGGNLKSIPILDEATLRPKREILDAQQLTKLQHWAARNEMRTKGLPADLIFRFQKPGGFPWQKTKLNLGVVAERHYALNWMTGLLHPASENRVLLPNENWDYVDTPT